MQRNVELFNSLLQMVAEAPQRLLDGTAAALTAAPTAPLRPPWKDPDELLSLLHSLATLIDEIKLCPQDLISRGSVLYYRCLVEGRSIHTRRRLEWRFAGRVKMRDGGIEACALYTDFISLFKQIGTLPDENVETLPTADNPPALEAVRDVEGFLAFCQVSRWGAVVCDLDDAVLTANRAFADLLGKELSDVTGRSFEEFLLPDDAALNADCLKELTDAGSRFAPIELRLRRESSVIWVTLSLLQKGRLDGREVVLKAFHESSKLERAFRFQEQERAHLSRELHDGVAQDAAALWMFLASGSSSSTCVDIVRRMAGETQRLLCQLRNPIAEGSPLERALRELFQRLLIERGLRVELDLHPFEATRACSSVVFRIVQEALQNVSLHGGVDRAVVSLRREGSELLGEVKDQGRGFDTDVPSDRFGLVGMRERCELLGGSLLIFSKPSEGTTVRFRLPLSARNTVGREAR